MTIEELANFLIVPGEESDIDYDWDENSYLVTHDCWYTPIGVYPNFWNKSDVLEEIIKYLESEVKEDEGSN